MPQRLVGLLIALLVMVPSIADRGGKELKPGDLAPGFTLKDIHDREHSLKKLLGDDGNGERIAILVMGDRKVRKEADKWAAELDRICKKSNEVSALMVADFRGKPFFVTEGMVKRHIKGANPPIPIVLDCDGEVNKRYKVQRGKANVFVVDRDGRVCYRRAGSYSEEIVQDIQESVQHILAMPLLSMNETKERVMASAKQ